MLPYLSSMTGQRFSSSNPKYIKHPTAGSGWVSDGEPLDAGTGMILANNISHLEYESCKHLFNATGDIYPPQDDSSGWTGIGDGSAVVGTPSVQVDELQISWDRRTSMVFGPFVIPQDRELSSGLRSLRKVVVHAGTYNGAGTELKIYAYLTPNKNNPSVGYYSKATTTTSAVGKVYKRLELTPTAPALENYTVPAEDGNTVQVRQVYIWVGFKLPTGSDVLSVSAFESR